MSRPNRIAKFGNHGQRLNAMINEMYQAVHYLNGTGGLYLLLIATCCKVYCSS